MEEKFATVVLTGLSGSGKSTALHVFEDLGFFCVDGLPLSLIDSLVENFSLNGRKKYEGLVLGLDMRQEQFSPDWENHLAELRMNGPVTHLLFFEADSGELVRRYSTTRRPHPLETKRIGLEQAIAEEKKRLIKIRDMADLVQDTTHYSIHDLRRSLQEKWRCLKTAPFKAIRTHLLSFGFKYGLPGEVDLLFDLRFLPNPYFIAELRELSGLDDQVASYVLQGPLGREFVQRLWDFIIYLLPLYEEEGRFRLTIGFGCTGGKHRSVAISEYIFDKLIELNYTVTLEHRNINQG